MLHAFDPLPIGFDNTVGVGLHKAVNKPVDLLLEMQCILLQRHCRLGAILTAQFPCFAKHCAADANQRFLRAQAFEHVLERFLDIRAADRLALAWTAFLNTQIIRVFFARPALRPAGGERIADLLGQKAPSMARHYSRTANLADKNRETIATLEREIERRTKTVKPSEKSVKPDQKENKA
ncbi:hypothetical protein [Tritonibacter mobilis]|uniref:hypothetical protein n=1 Tax=Tritonibacter mobilis TaxID=379347 RepID=UPI001402BCBC|nr:hypothetical protein [Tritonibacter mobilis]NHM19408.1 hypothetical protein [Tritonibacter mobilis]NHM23558.1 hypothetical protein [Tritonibacter mobilis]